jgi:glycosyltransferase involved in cell wall biosynthesis
MPTRNQVEFISESIQSVLSQSHKNVELIIADGISEDGTIELLKHFGEKDTRVRWFSERDSGPAQAVNKALSKARGTIIGWLNSDDLYAEGAIERVVEKLGTDPKLLMVYGESQNIDKSGAIISHYPTLPPATPLEKFKDGCFISQPTVFFRRTMHLLLGPLNESLKTAFDFDYWIRAFKNFSNRIGFVGQQQAFSRIHSLTITSTQRRKVLLEGMTVLSTHLAISPKQWVLAYANEVLAEENTNYYSLREELEMFLELATAVLTKSDLAMLTSTLAAITRSNEIQGAVSLQTSNHPFS